jgi:hypothetical protein
MAAARQMRAILLQPQDSFGWNFRCVRFDLPHEADVTTRGAVGEEREPNSPKSVVEIRNS